MKLSEIRAKFPQYGDMSDDQLIIGLHRKFYSDIPIGKFTQQIEYDTAKADPTEGMSTAGKLVAGYGKAGADLVRGIGQFTPFVSREDVAESRRLDAPLMKTGAGMTGNIAGNVAALLPTAFIPGAATIPGAAAIGAVSGLAQPSTSTGETFQNLAIGGAAAPAAIMAARGARAGYQGAKALVEPLTRSGQERIAAQVLQSSATDPARAAALAGKARSVVPGSAPTLAQVADDPGLAQLERTILNNAEYAPALQSRFSQQRGARLNTIREIAGEVDGHYDAIKEGRRIFAGEDYANAMKQGADAKLAEAMSPQIESLMRRPSIQHAQTVAKQLAAENDVALTNFNSVEGLDWLKKALDNQISKASQPGSAIGKAELQALVQSKSDLMKTLEQIAPAYKTANDNFAAMSRQVNTMDVARSLLDKIQKPGSEFGGNSAKEMGDAYRAALSQAGNSVKKQTGMNKGIADVMSTADIARLEGVAHDLGRKAFAETAGRSGGSPTAQNLASQNMLRRTLGPTGLPESWAESTMLQALLSPVQMGSKLTGADRRVMERIAASLLDPNDAAGLLMFSQPNVRNGLLGAPVQRLLPGASAGLLGVQFPQ